MTAHYFPLVFVSMWLLVSTLLGFVSGWYGLMKRYPDRKEEPLLSLRGQTGSLGATRMRSVLRLSVCPSGLRVGIIRVFGLFSRDFFVPWEEITVKRRTYFFMKVVDLEIGALPNQGRLTLSARVADRLAQASEGRWPEP